MRLKIAADFVAKYVEKVRPRFAKNMKGGDDGTLFLNWTGARLDINRLLEIIKRNAKAAGIPKRVTALTFRHSLATALLENGLGIRYIQQVLPLASLQYRDVLQSHASRAASRFQQMLPH